MPSPKALGQWLDTTPDLPFIVPDYHRLQVEWFIWRETHRLQRPTTVVELGAEFRRPYLTHLDYLLVNIEDPSKAIWANAAPPGVTAPDVFADFTDMPFPADSYDVLIATETMEHVADPFHAMKEAYRVLRPGGMALLSTPFMWPYHGGRRYPDYWRFTGDGWRRLCCDFSSVRVWPTEFTPDSPIQLVADSENMGSPDEVRMATGYLVKAVK